MISSELAAKHIRIMQSCKKFVLSRLGLCQFSALIEQGVHIQFDREKM